MDPNDNHRLTIISGYTVYMACIPLAAVRDINNENGFDRQRITNYMRMNDAWAHVPSGQELRLRTDSFLYLVLVMLPNESASAAAQRLPGIRLCDSNWRILVVNAVPQQVLPYRTKREGTAQWNPFQQLVDVRGIIHNKYVEILHVLNVTDDESSGQPPATPYKEEKGVAGPSEQLSTTPVKGEAGAEASQGQEPPFNDTPSPEEGQDVPVVDLTQAMLESTQAMLDLLAQVEGNARDQQIQQVIDALESLRLEKREK
mmetsp:Transcript_29623/g.74076  ORF Transcript_29623/g.74076 Transcript_29623/m.74076 type:complete len:258 (+) Transcript_29623:99-872(+)